MTKEITDEIYKKIQMKIDNLIENLFEISKIDSIETIEKSMEISREALFFKFILNPENPSEQQKKLLNYLFENFDVNNISTYYSMFLINMTVSSKDFIKSWLNKRDEIAQKLEKEGLNYKKIMKHLY